MYSKYVYTSHTVRWKATIEFAFNADGELVQTEGVTVERIRMFKTTEAETASYLVEELDSRGINYRYCRWVEREATPHETKMHFRKWSLPPGAWEVVREYDGLTV